MAATNVSTPERISHNNSGNNGVVAYAFMIRVYCHRFLYWLIECVVCGRTVQVSNILFITCWWRKCHSFGLLRKKCERLASEKKSELFAKRRYLSSLTKAKIERGPTKQEKKPTDSTGTRDFYFDFFFSHSMVDFGPLAVISHCFRYCSCCRLFVDSNRKCSSLCKWCLVTCDLVTLAYDAADMRHNSVDIVDTKVSSTRKYVPLIFL